jgi:hypothetical protein
MTIKNVYVTDNFSKTLGWGNAQDVHGGGQDIHIMMTYELTEIIEWWREWKPLFSSMNPHVQDALQQAKVMHALSKDA